ncbi:MAG: DUF1573 domain-containing protein [Planctomycetota bacterium]|jgi:hypothetical protein
MKRHFLISSILVVATALLMQTGPAKDGTVTKKGVKKGPRIVFEKTVHDFGEVGPKETVTCEFKFINTGDDVLRVGQPNSPCPCTVAELTKTKYAPGESGVVTITEYEVPEHEGPARQSLIVPTNDKEKGTVTLTVRAKVVRKVVFSPKDLKILLRDEDTVCPEITLRSIDGRLFAIKNFKSTTSTMTCEYDPSAMAKKHVIRPKLDLKGFYKRVRGHVDIELTHPGCKTVEIPFILIPTFHIDPAIIVLFDLEPGKAVKKSLALANTLGEDFEVVSVSSEKGLISVLSKEKIENVYEFELEITPPADTSEGRPRDTLYIDLRSGKRLEVPCRGFYKKPKTTSESETE